MLPSSLVEASSEPSGEKATARVFPTSSRVDSSRPVATSQSRTVASLDAEASVFPSGLKATQFRFLVWPTRTARVVFLGHIPEPRRHVIAGGGEPSAVRAEGDRTHQARVALQARQPLMGPGVPEDDVGILRLPGIQASGGEHPSVGAEGERRDRGCMGFPTRQELTGSRVPELDCLRLVGIVAAGGQDLAVGREGRRPDLVGVAGQGVGSARRIEAPDPRRRTTREDERPAVGEEGKVTDVIPAWEDVQPARRGDVPDLDGLNASWSRRDPDGQERLVG